MRLGGLGVGDDRELLEEEGEKREEGELKEVGNGNAEVGDDFGIA